MKLVFSFLMLALLSAPSAMATLTAGIVPVAKSGGSTPTLQNSDISDNVGVGVSVGVPITATSFSGSGASLVQVSSVSPSGVSSFTISSLQPGLRYKLVINLTQNTSNGALYLTFNGDSGSNYRWTQNLSSDNAGQSTNSPNSYGSNGTATKIPLIPVQLIYSGNNVFMEINFSTWPSNNDNINVYTNGSFMAYNSGSPTFSSIVVGGTYAGSAALSSLTITSSAGTTTGTAVLYQLN